MKIALAGLLLALSSLAGWGQMNYSFSVPSDVTNSSLGVKDSSGALIRTISTSKPLAAGSYSGTWDGLTDLGATATNGPFTIVSMTGNPVYAWDGIIGDTSNNFVGWNRWHTFGGINASIQETKFTFVGNRGWATPSGTENATVLGHFLDTEPNTPKPISIGYECAGSTCNPIGITNDGTFLYMVNASSIYGASPTFVTKLDAQSGMPAYFSNGTLVTGANVGTGTIIPASFVATTLSEIDVNMTPKTNQATGAIAVQSSGNILAVAHGNYWNGTVVTQGIVKFFDKTTGSAVGSNLTIANPQSLAFNSAGLWVTGNGVLTLITDPSGANTTSSPIAGLSNPVYVATNPATNHIYVLDGGTSQQLKEFDASYTLVRTYGVAGGYTDCNPTVMHNKLMVDDTAITGSNTIPVPIVSWVSVEPNGDAWVAESFNMSIPQGRIQHLTPDGATFDYVAQIQTGINVQVGVSHTQPTRVFIGLLEYQIDYTVPNNPGDPTAPGGNNSWQVVRNWGVGTGGACGSSAGYISATHPVGILGSELLSNGRVYAVAIGGATINTNTLVELPVGGTTPLRVIGPTPNSGARYRLARDGSIYYETNSGSGASSVATIYHLPLNGFDGSNNPIYGAPIAAAAATYNSATQPVPTPAVYYGIFEGLEPTTGGVWPVVHNVQYNTAATTNLPHMAGIIAGRGSYLFAVSPERCSLYAQGNDSYPCISNVGSINTHWSEEGRNIIEMYGVQTSPASPQFYHYYEDGMFVGWFGPQSTSGYVPTGPNSIISTADNGYTLNAFGYPVGYQGVQPSAGGMSENNGNICTVTVNGDVYVYHHSESLMVPAQRWHISNLGSVHEYAGTGAMGASVALTTKLF